MHKVYLVDKDGSVHREYIANERATKITALGVKSKKKFVYIKTGETQKGVPIFRQVF